MKKLIWLLTFIAWMSAGGALPAFAQGIIAPGHAIGNGSSGTRTPTDYPILSILAQGTLGTSVNNPGTGTLESLLPPHTPTLTGNAYTMAQADLFKETRFANGGTNFTVTLPPSTTTGLTNGSRIVTNNIDSTATMTVAAGAGTQVNGGSSVSVGPTRSVAWIYDTTGGTPTWRSTYNGVNSLLAQNNLSDVASAATARTNLGVAIGSNVEAWSANLDTYATKTPPSGAVIGTTDTQTLTNKTISGAALNGTLSGNPSFSGVPLFVGLSSGTCSNTIALNSSNQMILAACPSAASSIQAGSTSVLSATASNDILTTGPVSGGTGTLTDSGFTVANAGYYYGAGFVNLLRNASLSAWFHGSSGTATTTAANTNWTAEGVFVIPTGASVTWSRQSLCVNGPNYYCLQVTGASSVTDIKIRFVVESFSWLKATGQTVTFQFKWTNNSGSSITPTLATAYPTTQDGGVTSGAGWSADTADLSATNLQACSNSSTCTEAYTLTTSGSANTGYEFVVDFGNNFGSSGDTFELLGFDARVTPGVATGMNSSPPTPEVRDPISDKNWNSQFYQTSYDNGTAPGANTHIGMMGGALNDGSTGSQVSVTFPTPMRAAGTLSYWDGAGNASKVSYLTNQSSSWNDNSTLNPAPFNVGTRGFIFGGTSTGQQTAFIHYAADASIWGK